MKVKCGLHRLCRLSAPVSFCALVLTYVLCGNDPDIFGICAYLLTCGMTMVFYPVADESVSFSLAMCTSTFILLLISTLFFREQNFSCLQAVLAVSFILLAVFIMLSFRKRHYDALSLFHIEEVWKNTEFCSRLLWCIVLQTLSLMLVILSWRGMEIVAALLSFFVLLLDVLLYMRNLTGRTYLLSFATENQLRDVSLGRLRLNNSRNRSEDAEMNGIYKRVLNLMEKEKPFLKEGYTMTDMLDQVGTNRLYLSQVVNVYFGQNFRQFINCHRILHSLQLMRENPGMKVSELALQCGFHSTDAYRRAFRANMKMNPGMHLASLRRSSDLSSLLEEDS